MLSWFLGMRNHSFDHSGILEWRTARDYWSQRPEVGPARLGAVGYCLGGGLAIALACADNRLKAIAPYYGLNPRPLEAAERMCPVVGSYPGKDFTAKAGRELEGVLERAQIPHDIKVYADARHSFFNDKNRASYNDEASRDSWDRVRAFFKEYV